MNNRMNTIKKVLAPFFDSDCNLDFNAILARIDICSIRREDDADTKCFAKVVRKEIRNGENTLFWKELWHK